MMTDIFIFMLECLAFCFIVSAIAVWYMIYKAEPYVYQNEDDRRYK